MCFSSMSNQKVSAHFRAFSETSRFPLIICKAKIMFPWYLSHPKSKEKGQIWPEITNGFSSSGVQRKAVCNASACFPQGYRKLFPMKVILTSAFLKQLTVEEYGELLYLKEADADESFHPTPPPYLFVLEVSSPPPPLNTSSHSLSQRTPILIPFHQCRSRQEPLDPVMPRLSTSDKGAYRLPLPRIPWPAEESAEPVTSNQGTSRITTSFFGMLKICTLVSVCLTSLLVSDPIQFILKDFFV
jgi:hypothetical protein